MQYLRADTITEVTIGPALAVGDGFVPVTNLVGSAADEFEIIKHGATTTTTIAGTLAAITGADGYYALDLSATDTDTEGRLTLLINDDSLILPIRHEFMVVNANVFDSLFAASGVDTLDVAVTSMATNVLTAAAINAAALNGKGNWNIGKTGYSLTQAFPTNFSDLAITITTGRVTVGTIITDAISAASVAAAAANKIADHVLRRTFANAKASSDGDAKSFRSLLGAVAKLVNKISISGSTLTITEEDDSTSLGTQTVTTDAAADPITGVDTV